MIGASRRLAAWMRAGGSLSARLAEAAGALQVQVLRQGPVRLLPGEAARLGCPRGAAAYGREVLLVAGGSAVVYARSVLQAMHARGTWKAIRGLGTRSLADMLFGLPAADRSAFEFARFAPGSRVAERVRRRYARAAGQPWGRREVRARCSVFRRRGAALLVTECFAPAIARLAVPQRARATPWPRPAARRDSPAG